MIPLQVYKKLYISLKEHWKVEADLTALLQETLQERYIEQGKKGRLNPLSYAQKFFFQFSFSPCTGQSASTMEKGAITACSTIA